MRKSNFVFFFLILTGFVYGQQILQSPTEFFGRAPGTDFTPHHRLVDYYEHVAANSDNVVLSQYGTTNEGRPLIYAIVSSSENLKNLESIRKNHIEGLGKGKSDNNDPTAIAWLSYGVHGNEAGASESSIPVLYELAGKQNKQAEEWLKNTIVIIDPCINPDGFSRYISWYRSHKNNLVNADPVTEEHHEPWPGGRVNHYLFDLNRDWAWQTQVESQQRMKIYRQWMPHVHVDYHEMYPNDPYFFAPAAQPFHEYISDWQAEFQTRIGKNNARYFDREDWLYFTREVFDLLYPSYGDTYPTFNGAIGMTYEQGGHSQGGLAFATDNGDTLRLSDRIAHHLTTSLSSIETCSKNAVQLVKSFQSYFQKAQNNQIGKYKSYVIKSDNAPGKIKALIDLLDKNGIAYGTAKSQNAQSGFNYLNGRTERFDLSEKDLVIDGAQLQSVLLQVLFEPQTKLADSLTYDITAWSIPYAYGLKAYALEHSTKIKSAYQYAAIEPSIQKSYAYLIPFRSMNEARMLGDLAESNITVRRASVPFSLEGKKYQAGTVVINSADNRQLKDRLPAMLTELAKRNQVVVVPVKTGFSDKGPDLGSDKMKLTDQPRVLVLSGQGTNEGSFGEVWYHMEQMLDYPLTVVNLDRIRLIDLSKFNVIVMPEGSYDKLEVSSILKWAKAGGRIIAIGTALKKLENESGVKIERKKIDFNQQDERDTYPLTHEGQERRSISNLTPGSVIRLKMDNSHPLAYGFNKHYYSLKNNDLLYSYLKKQGNVGYIDDQVDVIGFVGKNVKKEMEESLIYGVQKLGKGELVILADNPLFRGFWYNGHLLFDNALFMP